MLSCKDLIALFYCESELAPLEVGRALWTLCWTSEWRNTVDIDAIVFEIKQKCPMVCEVARGLAMVVVCGAAYRIGSGAFIFFNLTRQDYSWRVLCSFSSRGLALGRWAVGWYSEPALFMVLKPKAGVWSSPFWRPRWR